MDRQTVILQLEDNCYLLLIAKHWSTLQQFGFADHFGKYDFRSAELLPQIGHLTNNILCGNSVLVVTRLEALHRKPHQIEVIVGHFIAGSQSRILCDEGKDSEAVIITVTIFYKTDKLPIRIQIQLPYRIRPQKINQIKRLPRRTRTPVHHRWILRFPGLRLHPE